MDKINIIIADDSDFVRDGMRIILDVNEDFEVLGCARNGREAIEIAKESAPDIFLMDIQMPEMDGIEAVKQIKVIDPNAKVIMCSAMGQQSMVMDAIKAVTINGAYQYFEEDIKNNDIPRRGQF